MGQGRGFAAETAGLQTLHSGWRSPSSGCESTTKGCRGWGVPTRGHGSFKGPPGLEERWEVSLA